MSTSTDGQLCFGVAFPEEYEFPWNNDELDLTCIEDWWRHINNFVPLYPHSEINWERKYGEPTDPEDERKIQELFAHENAWDAEHPLPVTPVNYYSDDCQMYILAVPSSFKYASQGYPNDLGAGTTLNLSVSDAEAYTLLDFITTYVIPVDYDPDDYDEPIDMQPHWYLSSYWG